MNRQTIDSIAHYILPLEQLHAGKKRKEKKRQIANEPEYTPLSAAYPRTWVLPGIKPGANTHWRRFDLPPIELHQFEIFFLFGCLSDAEILMYIHIV